MNDLLNWFSILIAIALFLLGVWSFFRFFPSSGQRRAVNHPRSLFHELCQAHGLDRPASKALWDLARQQRFTHPGRVFIDPDCFAAAETASELSSVREQLLTLREKLFAPGRSAVESRE